MKQFEEQKLKEKFTTLYNFVESKVELPKELKSKLEGCKLVPSYKTLHAEL